MLSLLFASMILPLLADKFISFLLIVLFASASTALLFWKERETKQNKSLITDLMCLCGIIFTLNFLVFMGAHRFGLISMPHSQFSLSAMLSLCFSLISCTIFYGLKNAEESKP